MQFLAMLGTFPKVLSQLAIPKGILPSGNFQTGISQAATSQVWLRLDVRFLACSNHSAQPSAHPSHSAWPPIAAYGATEGLT